MQFPGDVLPFVLAHLLDMGGEHAKAFIGFPQFLFGPLSFGDIPPCPEGNHRRTLRDDRQKYLDPEFLAGQVPMDPLEGTAAVTQHLLRQGARLLRRLSPARLKGG